MQMASCVYAWGSQIERKLTNVHEGENILLKE